MGYSSEKILPIQIYVTFYGISPVFVRNPEQIAISNNYF